MTSEASIPEPPNVFIFSKETEDAVPWDVTHVKVDPSVKEMDTGAFENCLSLVEVEFSEGLEIICSCVFFNCESLKHVNKLPSTLKEIHAEAFAGCEALVEVEFSEGMQVIGIYAFYGCRRLKRIKFPSANMVIEAAAFSSCYILTTVDLPEGVQAIGEACFFDCIQLRHLRIPSSVVRIGPRAFRGCVRLASVHLLGNLHTIAQGTFCMCYSLTHVRIPSSVRRIECAAFSCCTRLISLELPEGLEMIDLDGEHNLSRSLVNLVLPPKQHVERLGDDDEYMETLKLRHVCSNVDDLVSKLKHRFDTLPVHRLCYYQSYYPLTETMENLRQSMDVDPSAGTRVDSYGMTPFHILALSQRPELFLFQALLKVNKVDAIIRTRDKLGSTPMDYLCLNQTSDSGIAIQALLPAIIAQRLQWLGLAQWKSVISTAMNKALAAVGNIESSNQRAIALLCFKLSAYERLEAISLLELALWTAKINGCKAAAFDTDHEPDKESSPPKRPIFLNKSHLDHVDRQSCRINSGAEIVISRVLAFLDKVICRDDYYYNED